MKIINHFFCENCRAHRYAERDADLCTDCGGEWTDTGEYESVGLTYDDFVEMIHGHYETTGDLSTEATGIVWKDD